MNKRDLYIELVSEFILAKPGRPFEEVHIYAAEIGATEEDLKEAIFRVSKFLAERRIKAKSEGRQHSFEKFEVGLSISDQEIDSKTESNLPLDEVLDEKIDEAISKRDEIIKQKEILEKKLGEDGGKISKYGKIRLGKFSFAHVSARMFVLFFVAPLLLITSGIFLYQSSGSDNQSREETALNTPLQTPAKKKTEISFGPPIVYASGEKIDAKRIFSYPQTDVTLTYTGTPRKEIFGFLPYWMLPVADEVNIDLYSTIALFGLTTDGKGNVITSSSEGGDEGWYMWNSSDLDRFIARAKKKRIKVVLTVKSFNNDDIESLVTSDEAQRKFISNAIQLMNLKSLDGINIDFEYVGTPPEAATFAFTRFIANLNAEMKRQIPEAQLTIDTYLKSGNVRDLFDIQLLQDYVEAIVVMGYDVHTPNGGAGPVAPMEGENGIIGYMQSYLERVSPSKLILAVPYYGYDWPIIGPSGEGIRAGILSYAEIAASNSSDSILWNEQTQTPYYQYQDPEANLPHEVHFENARSLGIKYDYVNRKNLQGIGVWAMGYEGRTLELEQVILEKFAK